MRTALPAAVSLSTVGVATTIAITAGTALLLLDVSTRTAVLLGAVLAPTDAAAVFATLRGAPLRRRVSRILEAESGTNDPIVVLLVVGLSSPGWPEHGFSVAAAQLGYELAAGAAVGLAVGWLGVQFLRRSALPASGLASIAVFAMVALGYSGAVVAHASGFLAVYVLCVVIGNAELPHRPATLGFAEALAWLSQIGLFVLLGLLASPGRLPSAVLPALAIAVVLTLVARPISVVVATAPLRLPWREQAMLSWAGLRGAVPIVLATVPVTRAVDGADRLFDIVFVLVVALTLLQAPTLPWAARRLGLDDEDTTWDLRIESAPLESVHADLLQVEVGQSSRMHGTYVYELQLPATTALSLLVRDGHNIVPTPDTRLRRGDQLLIAVPYADRDVVGRRLRAVSRRGPLASWLGSGAP